MKKTLSCLVLTAAFVGGLLIAYFMRTYPEFFGLMPVSEWDPTRKAILQVGGIVLGGMWVFGMYSVIKSR